MAETEVKPKNKGGRPTNASRSKTGPKGPWKMTKDIVGKLEQAFSIDATVEEACHYAGINPSTYYAWKKENSEISESLERLRLNPVLAARQKIVNDIQTDGNMAKWFLERKRRKEYNLGNEDEANATKLVAQPILLVLAEKKHQIDEEIARGDVIEAEVVDKSPEIPAPVHNSNIMDDING